MTEQEAKQRLKNFGENLRRIIESKGVTRAEISARSGMHPVSLSYIINGKRYPTLWSIIRIREALGCTWEDLMAEPKECRIQVVHPDMGGFHQYACMTKGMQFKFRGDLNFCPICGRTAHVA